MLLLNKKCVKTQQNKENNCSKILNQFSKETESNKSEEKDFLLEYNLNKINKTLNLLLI
jgi:hypothetical protein